MDISVVIVTWNAKHFTQECLESLVPQVRGLNAELIVVDNASSDGTQDLIDKDFPLVRLVKNNKNEGFARANNKGISLSCGRYIFLINSDVTVAPGCLEKLLNYMETNPLIGISGPKMLGPDGKSRRSCMRFPTLWNTLCRAFGADALFRHSKTFGGALMKDFNHDSTMNVEVLNGWFWAVRRTALEEVGLLDEQFFMYCEDLDWCRRFWNLGWKAAFYSEAEAVHYGGASSSQAPDRFYIEMRRASIQYWKKHHAPASVALFMATMWFHEAIRLIGYASFYAARPSSRLVVAQKIKQSVECLSWLAGRDRFRNEHTEKMRSSGASVG